MSEWSLANVNLCHDDVIKWKYFPRYWPFVRGIHRSPVNSPHKVQWRGALMFSMICVWINGGVNNREAGDLRSYRAHYCDVIMCQKQASRAGTSNYIPQILRDGITVHALDAYKSINIYTGLWLALYLLTVLLCIMMYDVCYRDSLYTHGFLASVTKFHGWGKGGEGMSDDNEMFEWTAAVSCKPKVLFSYFGCQPDKFPASLVTPNKTRRSFVFVTGDFILYWIICSVSIF